MKITRGERLNGRTVIMAAGLAPEDSGFLAPAFGGWDIDQAVISLARAVLAEGGQLAFDGDEAMTTMVAMIAGEYQIQRYAEVGDDLRSSAPQVRAYRSEERSARMRDTDALLERLRLVTVDEGPRFTATLGERLLARETPAGFVCIGGDEAALRQAWSFAEQFPNLPLFALASTGGAAQRLAAQPGVNVDIVDQPIIAAVHARARVRREADDRPFDRRRAELEASVVPYPLIMQLIVDRIAGGSAKMREL